MWTMLMQMIPSAEAIGQKDCEASRTIGARTFVTCVAFTPCGYTQQGVRFRIGRLENEAREISSKMNDVLAGTTRDLKDDARRRQDIEKDIENEIAIAYCCRCVLAVIGHLPHGLELA
jgi:hypothetical protein